MTPSDMTPEQLEAAVKVAELALEHRDELESHRSNLEAFGHTSTRARDMTQLIDAVATYERRKHL